MTEPNRAPLNDTPELREETTAAYQLTADESAPGATPSNPASPAVAGDAASLRAQDEAKHLTTPGAAEPKPMPGQ